MKIFSLFSVLGIMSAVFILGSLPVQGLAQEAGDTQSQPQEVQPPPLPPQDQVSPQPQEPPQPQPRPIAPTQEGEVFRSGLRQEQRSAPQPFSEEGEQEQQEFIDRVEPRELKQVQSQINDLKRQAKQILKKTQKVAVFANEVNELNVLLSEVDRLSNAIRNAALEDQRGALQEFYEAQLWETLNGIRVKIELPQELKFIEKDLKRLEKLLATKKFSVERVDLGIVRTAIDEIKNAVAEARGQFNQGNFEEAQEALQVIHEGSHPGEIFGILQQLREMNQRLKKAKTEVKDAFHEALDPVYEAIRGGDFREANMMLQDIRNDLMRMFSKVKGNSRVNEDMQQKLQNLEQRLQQKQQQIQEEKPSSKKPQSYQPYQASVLDAVSNWATRTFGW